MRRLLTHRSAQSLAVAVIAVMLALGGTALATGGGGRSSDASAAAAKKKKHKRPSRSIRRYVARYVKHHPGPRGRRGPVGTTGSTGPAGQGATAMTGYVITPLVQMDPGDQANITAECPAGFVPTGGGFDYADYGSQGNYEGDDKDVQVSTSSPIDDDLDGVNDGWFVYVRNFGNNPDARARAYAACAAGKASPSQLRHARTLFARQPALKLHH